MRTAALGLAALLGCDAQPSSACPTVHVMGGVPGILAAGPDDQLYAVAELRGDAGSIDPGVDHGLRVFEHVDGAWMPIGEFEDGCDPSLLVATDRVYLAWSSACTGDTDGQPDDVYLVIREVGAGWSGPVNLTSGFESELGRRAAAPALVSDRSGEVMMAYTSSAGPPTSNPPRGEIRLVELAGLAISGEPARILGPPPGTELGCAFPVLVADADGELHVLAGCADAQLGDIVSTVEWSTRASGWQQRSLGPGSSVAATRGPDGLVHVVYSGRADSSPGVYARRLAREPSEPVQVTGEPEQFARIATGPDGLIVAMRSYAVLDRPILSTRSADGGEFSEPCALDPPGSLPVQVMSLVEDPAGGPPFLGYNQWDPDEGQ